MIDDQPDSGACQLHLYLSRHGETVWNTESRMQGRGDSPLTGQGVSDAQRLSDELADIPLTAAYCSPAGRARQTTELALSSRSVPIIDDDRIQEMALGRYEGLTVQEAYALDHENMDAFFHHPEQFVPDGGETFEMVYDRIKAFLDDLKTNPLRQTSQHDAVNHMPRECHILVISHNITIKAMLTVMQKRPVSRLREGPPIRQAALILAVYIPADDSWQLKIDGCQRGPMC